MLLSDTEAPIPVQTQPQIATMQLHLPERNSGAAPRAMSWAFLIVLIFSGWQFLTVERNYKGNWTALFCTGDSALIPPELQAGTWVFRGSPGYDGQMYRYLAHDPFFDRTEHQFIDDPALRARRILIPGAAWLLAFGRQSAIDAAYIAAVWIFVFAGAYWLARIVQERGFSPAWAALFLVVPATIVSADRLTIDVSTTALTAGLIWYWQQGKWKSLYAVAALLCLSRETGFILWAALILVCLIRRRYRLAGILVTAALPAAFWSFFVRQHTYATGIDAIVLLPYWLGLQPWIGPFIRLLHPVHYDVPWARAIQSLDIVALAGMLTGFALAIRIWWREKTDLSGIALLLFVLSATAVGAEHFWDDVYGYTRPFSPLLLLAGIEALHVRKMRFIWLLPCLAILPRLFLQMSPQILGIIGVRV
jgi:hypothetical protein